MIKVKDEDSFERDESREDLSDRDSKGDTRKIDPKFSSS